MNMVIKQIITRSPPKTKDVKSFKNIRRGRCGGFLSVELQLKYERLRKMQEDILKFRAFEANLKNNKKQSLGKRCFE